MKAVFLYFDRTGQGIDATSPLYRNLLALKELRNAVVHYNPAFIEHVDWPSSLQQALQCSKIDVHNGGWVATFSQVEVADWAHRTVKDAVQLFAMISGYRDPFLVPLEFPGIEPWPSE